jgi:hypothetical protein
MPDTSMKTAHFQVAIALEQLIPGVLQFLASQGREVISRRKEIFFSWQGICFCKRKYKAARAYQ